MSDRIDGNKLRATPGLYVKGMMWGRNGSEWDRVLLRRYADGQAVWEPVTYVPADAKAICMRCLSTSVMWERTAEPNPPRRWHRCTHCYFDFLIDWTLE